ncbi:MAG: M1 family peptidase, partial [Saprospiraceae bacterium]
NDFEDLSKIRNREDAKINFKTDQDTTLRDFYWKYDRETEKYDTNQYNVFIPATEEALSDEDKKKYESRNMYEITFSNKGGLVMPIILEWKYKDGTTEIERIPAQIWRKNENKITKVFVKTKEVASVKLDPFRETADTDESNNTYGDEAKPLPEPSRFKVFKQKQNPTRMPRVNPMQKAIEKAKT